MKSCSITRTVVGAGLVASFMLMQGCSYFGGSKTEEQPPVIPPTPETTAPEKVEPLVEIKPVAATTAYTIVKGDTISGVAANYGLRWQDVVAVNPGITPNKIRVGQVIQLPGQVDLSKKAAVKKSTAPKATAPKTAAPKAAKESNGPSTVYVVKSGDSLGSIAHSHGVKVDAIRKANNMTSDKLSVNQKLTIPGAKKADGSKTKGDVKKADPVKTDVVPASKEVKPVEVAPVVGTNATPAPAEAVTPPPAPAPADAGTMPAPAPAPAGNTQTYTVKEGEDLYAVAIRWGVSPSDLKALNNLTSTDLKAGMVLRIPASAQ